MKNTAKYGLLGHPLGHSFSRKFHNERFERLHIDAVYENFDLEDISHFPALIEANPDLCGLNVTIPYKQAVMSYLDNLDPVAARIGAVNTIRFERLDGREAVLSQTRFPGLRLTGFNTDIIGFRDSIRPLLMVSPEEVFGRDAIPGQGHFCPHTHALVLGTGGASKAIFIALQDMGVSPVYVSRTAAPGRLTYQDLTPEVMHRHTVIVNCTPLGMYPHVDTCPEIPYECLTPSHVCFDAVYNPEETLFMRRAAAQGALTKCGYDMLVGQAVASYNIWTSED